MTGGRLQGYQLCPVSIVVYPQGCGRVGRDGVFDRGGNVRKLKQQLSLWEPEQAEPEDFGIPDRIDTPERIDSPFDPSKVRIIGKPVLVDQLVSRIRYSEIDLQPEFQRREGIWNTVAKSRLIESLLILLPLPAFYFDATDENRWVVIDGLQRLTVFKEFIVDKTLKLSGLEFLGNQYEGCTWDKLPRSLQRRIGETALSVFLIERPTPPEVKYHLFRRINTSGLPLSPQEIRHAVNPGPAVAFLRELAESEPFRTAIDGGIGADRMADREGVLRVLAFLITPYIQYPGGEYDVFLNDAMKHVNRMGEEDREALRHRFNSGMYAAARLFAKQAFRKLVPRAGRRQPLNKALLETWSVNLSMLSTFQQDLLVSRKDRVEEAFRGLLKDSDFSASISQGTGKKAMVQIRFSRIERLIQEVLKG